MRWLEDLIGLLFVPVALVLVLMLMIVYGCKCGFEKLFKE
jgi:hypothetical protein